MIAIGCDHGGYELKQKILAHLRQRGLEYKDFGCDSTVPVWRWRSWTSSWIHRSRRRSGIAAALHNWRKLGV